MFLLAAQFAWLLAMAAPVAGDVASPRDAALPAATPLPGVAAPKDRSVVAPAMEGVLLELRVIEGQVVKKGETLAVVDNRIALAAVRVAEAAASRDAELKRAAAELRAAERQLERVTQAHERKAAAEVELDQAMVERDKALALLSEAQEKQREAQAQLELERSRLDAHNVCAAFDGTVVRIDGRQGQAVLRTTPLLVLVNADVLRVDLHLPAAWYDRLRVGSDYELDAGPPVARRIVGRLAYREPTVDAPTNTFRCTLEIDNREWQFPAGFAVELTATEREKLAELCRPREIRLALPEISARN